MKTNPTPFVVRLACATLIVLLPLVTGRTNEPLANAVFTIGTTTTNSAGAPWVYLLWQPTDPNLLAGRKIAVYAKPGAANADTNYVRHTITQRQTDPAVIASLLSRAASIGDDLETLDRRITAMFAAAVPRPNIKLEEKISAVIRGAEKDPQLLGNVIFLGRLHPALNMALGHAWAEPIPAGVSSFEVRDFDAASNSDRGVIGRVTVDSTAPIVLPAPGQPQQYKEASAKGDLNIKLRWATPNSLREVGLLQHGFNVFRMTKAAAEQRGFHNIPPLRSELPTLLDSGLMQRINDSPVTVNKLHDAISAANFANDPTWYIADDNRRYQPGGVAFQNGDQFYYFATARDLLGRDGEFSQGGLAVACDRLPPEAPGGVAVENLYTFNAATSTSNQVLKVTWRQASNTNDFVAAYYVYRWTNATDSQTFGLTNPLVNRIAGPIAHQPGQTFSSYVDNGAGSPHAPEDYGKTFWYTVRATDVSACTNNLSANSAPAFGVLRDRIAPGAATGDLGVLCCHPEGRSNKDFLTTDSAQSDTNLAYYRFTAARTNSAVAFAEFYITSGARTNVVGRVPFDSASGLAVLDWSVNREQIGIGFHRTFCRLVAKDDRITSFIVGSNAQLPPPGARHDVNFVGWVDCQRVRPTGGLQIDCAHTPIDPNDGSTIEPIHIHFLPAPGTKEFRLYRRVDGGPLTLIKQGPITNHPPVTVEVADPNPPANSSVVCYFVQCLDEHGNAGPLAQIGDCLRIKLPGVKPLLSPLVATGAEDAPEMTISWFCPPFGLERFEVYISPAGGASMPADIGGGLTLANIAQPVTKWVKLKPNWWGQRQFWIYRTPRVGPQFGDGGFFETTVKIDLNRKYLVFIKPVGLDGEPDPDSQNSKVESFLWSVPVVTGPKVPWPARPLPGVSTNDYPAWMGPVFINNTNVTTNFVGVGIVVGATSKAAREHPTVEQPAVIDGNHNPMDWIAKNQNGESLFPCVVYRYQETNSAFPGKVSGDIVQVTPLMDRIAYNIGNDPQFGTSALIYDPFIDVYSTSHLDIPDIGGGAAAGRNALVLLDTQPVLYGARYRYLIVRFGDDGEILDVVPTASVDVQ